MTLSTAQKFSISRLVFGASFPVAVLCMIEMARSFTPHGTKVWFGILMIDCLIGIPFGLAYYWYRSRLAEPDTGQIEVNTLAHTAITPAHLPDPPAQVNPPIDQHRTDKPNWP